MADVSISIDSGALSGSARFSFTPVDDTDVEGEETVTVSGTATGLTVNAAVLTIVDDDGADTTSGWISGVFLPASTFAAQCQVPRIGNDPRDNRPYPDVQGRTVERTTFCGPGATIRICGTTRSWIAIRGSTTIRWSTLTC